MQNHSINGWQKKGQTKPDSYTIQLEDIYPTLTQTPALFTIYNDSKRTLCLKWNPFSQVFTSITLKWCPDVPVSEIFWFSDDCANHMLFNMFTLISQVKTQHMQTNM